MTNAIDSIFGATKLSKPGTVKFGGKHGTKILKTQITRNVEGPITKKSLETPMKVKARKSGGSSADPFQLSKIANAGCADFTEEGYKIYTPEELNIGKGGNTSECPFDCKCCF